MDWIEAGAALIRSPAGIAEQVVEYSRMVGGFEITPLRVNFDAPALATARDRATLFGRDAVPRLR